MESPSAGSSRDAGAPPPVAPRAPPNAAGAPSNAAPVDTTHLDRLVEKALTAEKSGRYTLAAAFFRRAAGEALRLHKETFECTYLTLQRSHQLSLQAQLEGVQDQEKAVLRSEAWALAASCVPLIDRRMDANTMLPGRDTAVETAFFKRYKVIENATYDVLPWSARDLQLLGLSMGFATAVMAANVLLALLPLGHNIEAQAFVLRVVDCMLPAARSLSSITNGEEVNFAFTI